MKITYFKAKNFADIYSGLKRHTIEIDLSKSKNRIILLVGPNGSGKTAILNKLHPFAFPGNMDVRNGAQMILENENGYKEIHFSSNGNVFVIKHFYQYASGKGLKSFISKNGTELNPNGNVSSFKELVYMHMGLEQDLMKLLRLGSNVTGIIDMKATERKNFASNLLSDIDIYSKFYRKVSDDSRIIKATLRSVAEKINKLHIYDEKDEAEKMSKMNKELIDLKQERDTINTDIGKFEGLIQMLVPDGMASFSSKLQEKESERMYLKQEINSIQTKMRKTHLIIAGDIEEEIHQMEDGLHKIEGELVSTRNMIDFYFTQLNNLYSQREDKLNSLKYVSSELEYGKLSDLLVELHREKEKLDAKFKNFNTKCTRTDMLEILSLMQEIEKIVNVLQEADASALRNTINHILRNENVEGIVRREVAKIDDRLNKINAELLYSNENIKVDPNRPYILYMPQDSTCLCPYKKFYEDVVSGGKHGSTKEKLLSEQKNLEVQREKFLAYLDVDKNIDYIMMIIKSNRSLIERAPENFFDIMKLLQCIRDYTPFYDEEYITRYISLLEEYERYKELNEKIAELRREKAFIEKNSSTLSTLQKDLQNIDQEIERINVELNRLRDHSKHLEDSMAVTVQQLDKMRNYQAYQKEEQNIQSKLTVLDAEILEMTGVIEKVKHTRQLHNFEVEKRNRIDHEINKLEAAIQDIRFRLMEFSSLQKEKQDLEEKFEDIEIIKESLSSNKGIPLLFIQLYMKNARGLINDLLEPVYHGELEIGEFEINDKEFRIPYIKNGVIVQDAEFCSQGERSFISLALSFALTKQSLVDQPAVEDLYNIMLLDEIDATLDTEKRTMFITILEKQLESIGAEQVFVITHNNMFDNYPVDVIMTADSKIDNFKNINIIFKG